MGNIAILPLHEAQKIAAGEIVERPANIVKELIENALDAHATHITITIKDGGKEYIRITDNGCGMDKDDAQLCFSPHATSKITHINDLHTVQTFGFRGEALASIAAVSCVQLITKQEHMLEGTRVTITNSTIQTIESTSAQTGTDIMITHLFDTIPARKKFLKTRDTEWRHINFLFQAYSLAYPDIHFTLISDGTTIYNCPVATSLSQRWLQLMGNNKNHTMLTVQHTSSSACTIDGIISSHQSFRYDRSGIFFFVNKRWIRNLELYKALMKGYLNVLPADRYPHACIIITIDPNQIDINIHPRKEEIKFINPRPIAQLLTQQIKKTLEHHISTYLQRTQEVSKESFSIPYHPTPPLYVSSTPQVRQIPHITHVSQETTIQADEKKIQKPITEITASSVQSIEKTDMFLPHIIGQLHKTYILLEQEDGLFIVDQHAAHERIMYEKLYNAHTPPESIKLIFPQLITLTAQDIQLLKPYINLLHTYGIMIEPFGTQQCVIHAIPVSIKHISCQDLIGSMIVWIHEHESLEQEKLTHALHHELSAQMACKAAVKAGDTLTQEHMITLIRDLHHTAHRYTCPHGRPTGWLLHTHEIEKKCKRRL